MFGVYHTRQFMQSFPRFMLCKNKITVLIAIYWKVVCEIIRDTIGKNQLDKL